MVSTFDFQPGPSPLSPNNLARRAGGWCMQLKEAAVERYRDWRFDRDVWKIHTALEQLSDRQLDLIGCRREWLIEDVHRLVRSHAMVTWSNQSLPPLAWLPPLREPTEDAIAEASQERIGGASALRSSP
jgi:hypothetical protein